MACVALVFSPLAPVVAVAAAIVFWISSFVYKYQLMFVFVSKVESGGVRLSGWLSSLRNAERSLNSACGTSSSIGCSRLSF
jgi:hypothetical protein